MESKNYELHTLSLAQDGGGFGLQIKDSRRGKETTILSGSLGKALTKSQGVCTHVQQDSNSLTLEWSDVTLTVAHTEFQRGRRKYDVTWTGKEPASNRKFLDCFRLEGGHWYGVAQVKEQTWPIEQWSRKTAPFVTGDSYKDDLGGVQEPYLVSSLGVAVWVHPDTPLFMGINQKGDGLVTLGARHDAPFRNTGEAGLTLRYTLFQGENAKTVHQLVLACGAIPRPLDIPHEALFRHPIWTTWARYKKKVDQKAVIEFAKEIKDNGFEACQLEIDDDWTSSYGDMEFDFTKFPSPREMVGRLHDLGLRVTLWVHPFASPFSQASQKDYWVKSTLPGGMSKWWNGLGKSLDVTNPEAVTWYKSQLRSLKEKYGITSFKFDAGEASWLPWGHRFARPMTNPSGYTTAWAELAHDMDRDLRCQEVRVGYRSQQLPIFVRMMDKDSNWSYAKGLRSLIPHALTFSILGYPFILPDMIGGNAYRSEYPDRELFIRWLEANVFLPCVQFSICPWQYDEEVVKIAQNMMALREKYADKLIQLARGSCETGDPIIRPLWWIAPEDPTAQTLDSEFLVGNDLLVAPVLDEGARMRDVYLPAGRWRDELRGKEMEGGQWYRNHAGSLDELPFFTLISPGAVSTGDSEPPQTKPANWENVGL